MSTSRSPSATPLVLPIDGELILGRLANVADVLTASPSSQFVQNYQDNQASQPQLCLSSPSPPLADDSGSSVPQESQLVAEESLTQDNILASSEHDFQAPQSLKFPEASPPTTSQFATSQSERQPQPFITPATLPTTASSSTSSYLPHNFKIGEFNVIDFVYLPKPALLEIPLDEEWVVSLPREVSKIPGGRECAAAKWERNHAHLFRGHGNRADPPGTIPKKWGGFPKEIDEALMRAEEDKVLSWERRLRERGLSPTESAHSSPRSPPTQEEQDAWFEAYELNIRREMDAMSAKDLKMKGKETIKALEAAKSSPLSSIEDPPRPRPTFGSLRVYPTLFFGDDGNDKEKQEEQSLKPVGRTHVPVDISPKRKREPSKNNDEDKKRRAKTSGQPPEKRTKTVQDIPSPHVKPQSRYFLRNREQKPVDDFTVTDIPGPSNSNTKRKLRGKGKASKC